MKAAFSYFQEEHAKARGTSMRCDQRRMKESVEISSLDFVEVPVRDRCRFRIRGETWL